MNKEKTTQIWLFSLRRSGTHLIQNYLKQMTGFEAYNNVNLDELHRNHVNNQVVQQTGCKIFGIEDHPLQYIETIKRNDYFSGAIGKSDNNVFIVNIRDVYNMAASRIKHWRMLSSEGETIYDPDLPLGYWEQYALNYKIQTLKEMKDSSVIWINFNGFITKEIERLQLQQFISEYTLVDIEKAEKAEKAEKTLNKIDINGCGSSFCGRDNDNKQFTRYRFYESAPAFRKQFTPGINELNEQIFGFTLDFKDGEVK